MEIRTEKEITDDFSEAFNFSQVGKLDKETLKCILNQYLTTIDCYRRIKQLMK